MVFIDTQLYNEVCLLDQSILLFPSCVADILTTKPTPAFKALFTIKWPQSHISELELIWLCYVTGRLFLLKRFHSAEIPIRAHKSPSRSPSLNKYFLQLVFLFFCICRPVSNSLEATVTAAVSCCYSLFTLKKLARGTIRVNRLWPVICIKMSPTIDFGMCVVARFSNQPRATRFRAWLLEFLNR